MKPPRNLPSGTVTFVFSDIEGSTRLLRELGEERYGDALVRHRSVVRAVVAARGGVEFGTEGDAFFLAFNEPSAALATADEIQRRLAEGPIHVRIGIHSGRPLIIDDDYVGLDVHKAARICSAGSGGQVLVSEATRGMLRSDVGLRDLGAHRLKDLTAPEHLYQLGAGEFPPLRTLHHTNLPVQQTALVGRDEDLKTLLRLAETSRLLTLTGPGGIGKTRLSLELAARLSDDYAGGTWWVPLAGVGDHRAVESTIVDAIGAQTSVAEHVGDKRSLLLLDNFEQVIDAAARVGEILAAAPPLMVIVTSRERLALAAEQEFPVSPLDDDAAVELFMARARQLKPTLEPDAAVSEICRRLDRLPLALELASSRIKLLSPQQILSRLERSLDLLSGGTRDKPERQATMRAAIDWSYGLLSQDEQRFLRALGVFSGSFDLDAAQNVGGGSLDELQSLAEKSLLRQTEASRFFLLDTTREFARERLVAEGESSIVERRHAMWYASVARNASGDAALLSERGDVENIRDALEWLLDHDLAEGVHVVTAISDVWHQRARFGELVNWFDRARSRFDDLDDRTRLSALEKYAHAVFFCEQMERIDPLIDEGLHVARRLGDRPAQARLLNRQGSVMRAKGDVEGAIELGRRALELFRESGDASGVSASLHHLGEHLRDAGRLGEARQMLEEAAAERLAAGMFRAAMTSLHSLGDLALDAGDMSEAGRRYLEAFRLTVDLADERSQAYCTAGLACIAASLGDPGLAGRLWLVTETVEERLGARLLAFERRRYERGLVSAADDQAFRARERIAGGLEPSEVVNEFVRKFGSAGTDDAGSAGDHRRNMC